MLVQIEESKKLFHWFLDLCDQKWVWPVSSWEVEIFWMSVWIELIFCMLPVMQWFVVKQISYPICLTFKCQSTEVVLVRPLALARRILWNRVCPSFPPAACLVVFLELDYEISLNFGMTSCAWLVHNFFEKLFCPKNCVKMCEMCQK